jgi:hypothetical protein
MNKLIVLFFLGVFPASVFAGENYKKIDDFIALTYQKGDVQNAPWHKKRKADAAIVSDYSLCYHKMVSQKSQHYLVVMCPDMSKSTYGNEPFPTDLYVLQKTDQGYTLLASEQDSGEQFKDVVNIGSEKWAVHGSSYALNQGYQQANDTLSLFVKNTFIRVAQWTSLQDNSGAISPREQNENEHIENKLSIDSSQPDADFYPLIINSFGNQGATKINEKYKINYAMDHSEYIFPDKLNEGY